MKNVLPFSTDYTVWEDNDGIPYVFLWGNEGEGSGRVAMVYGEVDGEGAEAAKEMTEFVMTACNDHYKLVEALAKELYENNSIRYGVAPDWDLLGISDKFVWSEKARSLAKPIIRDEPPEGFTECPQCAQYTYNGDLGICETCNFTD